MEKAKVSFRRLLFTSAFLTLAVAFFFSCTKTTILPGNVASNPFDTVNYNQNYVPEIPIDSASFLGIHKYILSVKCAMPACHDGSFEPDYRTVQSAYNTLVYAPVLKNDSLKSFKYRVLPGDTALSWLHERITTNDPVLGKMPLYDTLYPNQIRLINKWIMDGAKDVLGNTKNLPNPEPALFGIVAYLPNNGNYRLDTIRGNSPINPFAVPKNTDVEIWFGVYDDNWPWVFNYNKVKFSKNILYFDGAPELPLTKETVPFQAPAFDGSNAPYFLHYKINTSAYNSGDIVYMQVYVQDGDHASPIALPGENYLLRSYMAFVVQ